MQDNVKVNADVKSRRGKRIGILAVCVVFVCAAVFCLWKQRAASLYSFPLENMEQKTGYLSQGEVPSLRSDTPSENFFAATPRFLLPEGDYVLEVLYSSTAAGSLLVQGNNNCVFEMELPPTNGMPQTASSAQLKLPIGTDRGICKLYQLEEGEIELYSLTIYSDHHLYRDYYLLLVIFAFLAALLILVIINYEKIGIMKECRGCMVLLLAVLILVNIPFFSKRINYKTDTQAHLKRIEAISEGLKDGQFPVIVGPNYVNEYGEIVALYPDLFLYIPALLRVLNVSMPCAYNLFMILINLLTAVTAVISARRIFSSWRFSLITAVIYLIEPIRMFWMLEMGAGAGMGIAQIFLPLVITGTYEILHREGKGWEFLAVGLWGMACSHVLSAVLGVLYILIYVLCHWKRLLNSNVIISFLKAAGVFFLLSIGELAQFFGYYFTDWGTGALEWSDYYHFLVDWDKELRNVIWILLLAVIYIGLKRTERFKGFGKEMFIGTILNLWISTRLFPWILFGRISLIDSFLAMIQYPHRFQLLGSAMISFALAEALCSVFDLNLSLKKLLCGVSTAALLVGLLANFYRYYWSDILFYDQVTGEMNIALEDYLPAGTLSEWYATDTGDFSDYEKVEAYSYTKTYTKIDCTYTARSEGEYMEFPLFWYKGYQAQDQNGAPLVVEKGERNRVRVYLTKSDEVQELHLHFAVAPVYTVSFVFSLLVMLAWLLWELYGRIVPRRS